MTKAIFALMLAGLAAPVLYPSSGSPNSLSALTERNEQKPVELERLLDACGPLFFQLGSAQINREDKVCLNEVAIWLTRIAVDYDLVIDGHRDASEPKNISAARARNIGRQLIEEMHIASARLILRDFSDTCPDEVSDRNRRVEFWYKRDVDKIESFFHGRCSHADRPSFKILK